MSDANTGLVGGPGGVYETTPAGDLANISLPDNADLFNKLQEILLSQEWQTLMTNFMKVCHDTRMSIINTLR